MAILFCSRLGPSSRTSGPTMHEPSGTAGASTQWHRAPGQALLDFPIYVPQPTKADPSLVPRALFRSRIAVRFAPILFSECAKVTGQSRAGITAYRRTRYPREEDVCPC